MKNVRVYTLFSGSDGNCHYLKIGNTELLVDAGKNAKAITSALSSIGTDIKNIKALFITHEHSDHTSAIRVLQKKNPDMKIYLHASGLYTLESSGADISQVRTVDAGEDISEGDAYIRCFTVPHDSCACLGYRFSTLDGKAFLGIATDVGHLTLEVTEGLCGCDSVIIESNHDPDMLRRGPYPEHLKKRILSARGHLSNDSCAKLCAYLKLNGTKNLMLAHLSKENNTPELALSAHTKYLPLGNLKVSSHTDPVCLTDEPDCK